MFCWSNSHDLQIRPLQNCSLLRKSAKHKWNWTQYQQVKQILNWYKTGMHHDCRLNWLNNFSLLYQSYIMHQNVLMGLGHTESRVTTNLLTLIFWWLQQMGAYSPAWRYRWNIIIGQVASPYHQTPPSLLSSYGIPVCEITSPLLSPLCETTSPQQCWKGSWIFTKWWWQSNRKLNRMVIFS